ncbi:hypothetical protein [Actinomadura vinacea]|uniref:hypothetical protein n=1 Tax=Actinomadura vinacea TaxID=115336 RepID=UPI0031DC0860
MGVLENMWLGHGVREAVGLLIAADARMNRWMLEVGKARLSLDEYLAVTVEFGECLDEAEAAWARYEALGIPEARKKANALPTAEERRAGHEQLSPRAHAAEETLLAVLRDILERIQRLPGGTPGTAPSSP